MTINLIAEVNLPTHWACFRLMAFEAAYGTTPEGAEPRETALALVLGDVQTSSTLARIHSQCATGDIFHSLRCDCHDQLHLALRTIAAEGRGVLIYEHQEGRGIGLMEKLRAYALQDQGLDTIEANLQLGHPIDLRNFQLPVEILRFLGVHSVRLMTNNPAKLAAVKSAGIQVTERLSASVPATPYSAHYIATKHEKLGHLDGPATLTGALSVHS